MTVVPSPIQRVAEVNFSGQLEVRNRLLDESSAAARWLLATLVTVNSGAVYATFSSDALSKSGKLTASGLFCAGVFWAVMLGYATIFAVHKVMPALMSSADFWVGCILKDAIDGDELVVKQRAIRDAAKPWQIASHAFGWLSLICFLGGVLIAGSSLK